MMIKKFIVGLFALMLVIMPAIAGEMIMIRSQQMFPEAMITLQNTIRKHGYRISRVQRVDIGLTKSGYKTDRYRVVFFGKASEIRYIANKYPQLAAYLPMKISLFAEGQETIMLAADPMMLDRVVSSKELKPILKRWSRDIRKILEDIRKTRE